MLDSLTDCDELTPRQQAILTLMQEGGSLYACHKRLIRETPFRCSRTEVWREWQRILKTASAYVEYEDDADAALADMEQKGENYRAVHIWVKEGHKVRPALDATVKLAAFSLDT